MTRTSRPQIPVRSRVVSLFVLQGIDLDAPPAPDDLTACRVLLMRRNGTTLNGEWCQIAGGLEEEDGRAWQGALRELREETGLVPARLFSADVCECFYSIHDDAIEMIPVFVATVPDDAVVTLNEEHSDWRWCDLAEARALLPFAGQRHILDMIRDGFVTHRPHGSLELHKPWD